jgi:hypothetical protein
VYIQTAAFGTVVLCIANTAAVRGRNHTKAAFQGWPRRGQRLILLFESGQDETPRITSANGAYEMQLFISVASTAWISRSMR